MAEQQSLDPWLRERFKPQGNVWKHVFNPLNFGVVLDWWDWKGRRCLCCWCGREYCNWMVFGLTGHCYLCTCTCQNCHHSCFQTWVATCGWCHNLLKLAFWCFIMVLCLASLKVTSSKNIASWFIHVSLSLLFSSMLLLMDLTHSFHNCLSAFLIFQSS